MRSCSSAISAFGVVVRMVTSHRLVRPAEALPEGGERQRLAILTGDRIGLLAALDHLPLVERVRRHEAASPGRASLNMPDLAAVSERPLLLASKQKGCQPKLTVSGSCRPWRRIQNNDKE